MNVAFLARLIGLFVDAAVRINWSTSTIPSPCVEGDLAMNYRYVTSVSFYFNNLCLPVISFTISSEPNTASTVMEPGATSVCPASFTR